MSDAAGASTHDRRSQGQGRRWLPGLLLAALVGLGCSSTAPLNKQCFYDGRDHGVGASFPSTDGCNSCSCTAMGVACTERACFHDAGNPDADAGPNACAFDRTYRFWDDGGLVPYADRSTLGPARLLTVTRDHFMNSLPNVCSRELMCTDHADVDVNQIQLAFAHPDVVAALALTSKPFYGTDTRPVDGTVFIFERDDQHGFMLGNGSVPAGLKGLMDLLHLLHAETVATPACANL